MKTSGLFGLRAFIAFAALGYMFTASADIPTSAYVQKGLIAQYDGIDNAGTGTHDANATTWVDLKGENNLTLTKVTFGENCAKFASGKAIGAQTYTLENGLTFEIYAKSTAATGDMLSFQSSSTTSGFNFFCYSSQYRPYDGSKASFAKDETAGMSVVVSENGLSHSFYKNGSYVEAKSYTSRAYQDLFVSLGVLRNMTSGRTLWNGSMYSVRVYDRALTAEEIAWNAMIDRVRFDGAALPAGCRWNGEKQCFEVAVDLAYETTVGSVSIGDVAMEPKLHWIGLGQELVLTPVAEEGYRFYYWEGDLDGVTVDANGVATVPCGSARSLVCHFVDADHFGVRRAWSGGGDGKSWSDPANWDPAGVPGEQDDVSVAAGKSLVLSEPTPALDSLTVAGTLTFTNWMTRLNAGSVVVQNGGVVTCVGPFKDGAMSNRVWIACNTLDVKAGGVIHADKRGYAALNGPGMKNFTAAQRKTFRGGTYGGTAPGSGVTYGSLTEPTDPGTGGCGQQTPASEGGQNAGGGAIRIEATGEATVDGRVSADGATVVMWRASAGSGGSVYFNCRAIKGSGRVSASSTDYPATSTQNDQFQGGSGGRIAVHYSPSAQSAYDASGCTVGFYASGAVGWYVADYTALTAEGYLNNSGTRPANIASGGTLYFPDNRFLTNAAYASAGRRFAGEWHSAEGGRADIESPGDFKLDGLLDLREAVERLDVGGSLVVNGVHGRSAGLMLSNAVARFDGDCTLTGGCLHLRGGIFSVGGNMLMTGSNEADPIVCAQMHVRSLPTNGVDQIWGAQFDVGKTWTMSGKTVVYPYTHGTKGSVPFFHAKSFVLGEDAFLDGCMKGYDKGYGPGSAGGMSIDFGASHGGKGGCSSNNVSKLKPTYGVKERPVTPGSGGGDTNGKSGGSAIIIHVDSKMTFNGVANVQGRGDNSGWAAGGSGGSVYLSAKKFESETGRICAKGGHGSGDASYSRGIGGGGRVAIWAQDFGTTNIEINVTGGTPGNNRQVPAEPGTIYWGIIPPVPGFMIFVQ